MKRGASCCDSTTSSKHEEVSEYYKDLKGSKDLLTNVCTLTATSVINSHQKVRKLIHEDTFASFYGCGSPIPPGLSGATVVDLGCGSGVDVFVCSALVGDEGKVIGVDMTAEQLEKANSKKDYHFQAFKEAGYLTKPNVEFKEGIIEDLSFIEDNSVDVVISNCVINLSPNKTQVLKECYRILKEGGELYFSDVFASKRIPQHLQDDKVLWGECLSGALYKEDFRRIMDKIGFLDTRVCSTSVIAINNPAVHERVGDIVFYSITVRAFKLSALEDRCEDYGQKATYNGNEPDFPHAFFLDDHHTLITGYPLNVCGNTADMLSKTRYAKYFDVTPRGDHRGLFDCSGGGGGCGPSACGPGGCGPAKSGSTSG